MWKRYVGTGVTAILLAGLASLMTAGPAYAGEPVIAGDCDATVAAEDGEALTVDAGAVVGREGVVDIGLGSTSAGTGGEDGEKAEPLVAVPVADVVEVADGAVLDTVEKTVSDTDEPVSDTAVAGCETVTKTVNQVGETAQRAVSVQALSAGPLAPKPEPEPEPEPAPEPEPEPEPVEANEDAEAADQLAVEAQPVLGPVVAPQATPLVLPPLEVPDLSTKRQPSGPDMTEGREPAEKNSGRAHALPKSDERATRVPFVVAVIALAAVAAVMVRRWVSAK